ncbi:MAG TPA: UDP-N-acetylglucosamine 2-epimerase (hydrolyzing) [Methanophagales archaeon]|nr:UDP-N-acetylglucosamine 2-epimerase (hydrolyzing) [Methanophagales archaeon]
MKKIVYISGTRAEYGLLRRTLKELNKHVNLTIIATCMHLSPRFGSTVKEIERDGLKIKRVDMLIDNDSLGAMVKSFGIGIYGISQAIEEISPDLIFVEGDRGESLAGAIAGAHLNILVVHHGGGDVGGSIDNKIRYAITMFSDYHLTGNDESRGRLIKMGTPKERVFNVGEPGLDDIHANDFTPKEEIFKKYDINPEKNLILLVQHPNTEEYENVEIQIKGTLDAIKELRIQTIAIYSNADAGGRIINEMLEDYAKELNFLKVFPHVERRDFLGLMNVCNVMIGNSSAGIIELSSFKKPFVCVGSRQKNRRRAGNTIDVSYNKSDIIRSIKKALYDKEFREKLKNVKNPYGDGRASARIVKTISEILEGKL